MTAQRTTAIIWGILLLMGILTGILSSVPALEYPDYLDNLANKRTQVRFAVFSQAVMAVIYVCIAVLLYPFVKKYNENLASGYFSLRIIGAGFLFAGIVTLLLLLWLSETYVSAGQTDLRYYRILAETIRRGRDMLNHIGMILPWSIGGLILYWSLYRIQLLPNWISIWGIAGSAFTLIATIMIMLRFIDIVTPVYFILNTPCALLEIFLAFYLIVKGFNPLPAFPDL